MCGTFWFLLLTSNLNRQSATTLERANSLRSLSGLAHGLPMLCSEVGAGEARRLGEPAPVPLLLQLSRCGPVVPDSPSSSEAAPRPLSGSPAPPTPPAHRSPERLHQANNHHIPLAAARQADGSIPHLLQKTQLLLHAQILRSSVSSLRQRRWCRPFI